MHHAHRSAASRAGASCRSRNNSSSLTRSLSSGLPAGPLGQRCLGFQDQPLVIQSDKELIADLKIESIPAVDRYKFMST